MKILKENKISNKIFTNIIKLINLQNIGFIINFRNNQSYIIFLEYTNKLDKKSFNENDKWEWLINQKQKSNYEYDVNN